MSSDGIFSWDQLLKFLRRNYEKLKEECKLSPEDRKIWSILMDAGITILENGCDLCPEKWQPIVGDLSVAATSLYGIFGIYKAFGEYVSKQKRYENLQENLKNILSIVNRKLDEIKVRVARIDELAEKLSGFAYRNEKYKSDDYLCLVGQLDYNLNMIIVDIKACQRQLNSAKIMIDEFEASISEAENGSSDGIEKLFATFVLPTMCLFKRNVALGIIAGVIGTGVVIGSYVARSAKTNQQQVIGEELKKAKQEIQLLQNELDDYNFKIKSNIDYLKENKFPITVNFNMLAII